MYDYVDTTHNTHTATHNRMVNGRDNNKELSKYHTDAISQFGMEVNTIVYLHPKLGNSISVILAQFLVIISTIYIGL